MAANRYDYRQNPYSAQQNAYGGAQQNGYYGSRTTGSVQNAAVQGTAAKPASDPHASFGNAALMWAQRLTPEVTSVDPYGPSDGGGGPATPTLPSGGASGGGNPTQVPPVVRTGAGGRPVAPPTYDVPPYYTPEWVAYWQGRGGAPKPTAEMGYDEGNFDQVASWYRTFSALNPAFANITAADVAAYRANPQGMNFADWYVGRQAGPPAGPPPDGGGVIDTSGQGTVLRPYGYTGGAGRGNIPANTPPATQPPGGAAGPVGGNGDYLSYLRQLMNPLYEQERQDFMRDYATVGANTGAINSGAYLVGQSRGLADLLNNQGGVMGDYLFKGSESAKDRALQTALAEIGAATARENARAAASAAGAGGQAALEAARMEDATRRYIADLENKRFYSELPYQDKWHGYDFQLGQDQLGSNFYQYLLGLILQSSPTAGMPPLPGSYVTP